MRLFGQSAFSILHIFTPQQRSTDKYQSDRQETYPATANNAKKRIRADHRYKYTKTKQPGSQPRIIWILSNPQPEMCLVRAMQQCWKLSVSRTNLQDLVFYNSPKQPLLYGEFLSRLPMILTTCDFDASMYTAHSFQ